MAKARPDYGPLVSVAEEKELGPHIAQSFNFAAKNFSKWIRKFGRSNVRVVRDSGRPVGGCALYPMGQWWGGRSIPMVGIAAVGLAPEARASGFGSHLMKSVVKELASDRVPLSALYPATQKVYRRAGYEQAGSWCEYETEMAVLDESERSLPVRRATKRDHATIRKLYERVASQDNGSVDRSPWMWERTLRAAEDFPWEHYTYLVGPRGAEEGYVVYHHRKSVGTPWDYNIGVNDWAFTTERAGRRMLSFLKFHVGQAKFVRWVCGPTGGPLFMDREQWGEFARREIWMLRIVDVRKALAMRGYAPGVEVDVVLDIEDDIVRRNNGRFRFQVRGGRARVTTSRDGQRAVSLHVRSLAPLYSGLHSPTSLARMDRIDGHPDDLGLLGTAFAGPAPWMREHF